MYNYYGRTEDGEEMGAEEHHGKRDIDADEFCSGSLARCAGW